jgi:hypothetical protein
VSLLWTILSTVALVVLAVASLVVFELTVRPSSVQRQQIANVVWPLTGVLFLALWGWFLAGGKRRK